MVISWARLAAVVGRVDFLVLNTLQEPVQLVSCHRRPWFKDGTRVIVILPATPDALAPLVFHVEESPLPLLVVTRHNDAFWSAASETLASSSFGARVVQVVAHGNELWADGKRLPEVSDLDESDSTVLTVSAASQREFSVEMPCTISFRLAHPQSPANLVRLSVHHPDAHRAAMLPGAVWLRLRGAGMLQGALTIDLTPGVEGDVWSIQADSPQITVSRTSAPASATALRRVALVVDRTCPDWDQWSDALELALENHRHPETFPQFNSGTRGALQQTLRGQAWDAETRLQVVWFGDQAGQDVNPIKDVPGVFRSWGTAGDTLPVEDAIAAIDALTYMPGFDVWDPLGEALSECVPWFQRNGNGTVLIVGNSPPRYPSIDGPLRRIGSSFGFPTMYRNSSDHWDKALAALAAIGVGVYYVFLTLGEYLPGQEEAFNAFDTLQRSVAQQMSACLPGRVVQVTGNAAGIQRGVTAALAQAQNEFGRSSVEVLHGGTR